MSTINNLAHYYEGKCDTDYTEANVEVVSKLLQDTLVDICDSIAKVERLTYNKKIDAEYLLNIVGSYLMGLQEGSFTEGETEPPSKLFEESLYPTLQNINNEVEKEDIEDDSNESVGDPEGVDAD